MIVKNIIWDWNGTLVDDAYLFVKIMNITLFKHGLPQISLKEYKKNFCFPIQEYWQKLGFQFNKEQFQIMNVEFIKLYQSKMTEPPLQEGALKILDFVQNKCPNFENYGQKSELSDQNFHLLINRVSQFIELSNCYVKGICRVQITPQDTRINDESLK